MATPLSLFYSNSTWEATTATTPDATTTATGKVQLAGDLSGTAAAPTVTNSAVINKVLTGYTSTVGTVAATDNIVTAIGKLNANSSANANATHTGDATGATALTVKGINGTLLSGLSTGILKNTTTTGVPSIAVAADFPVLNQNTTGSAASFTGSLAGEVTGTQGATTVSNSAVINKVLTGYTSTVGTVAATDNIVTAIGKLNANSSANANATHTGDATGATALTVKGINGTLLSGLSTGILKNTTTTGVPSIAVAADFPVLNQNTTGTAASFTGSLAGDVTGTQGATVVTKLQGKSVSTTAPTNGQVLKYNTTTSVWEPNTDNGISSTLNSANILVGNATNVATAVAMSGDATMDNAGALTIGASKITSAKILDGSITNIDVNTSAAIAGTKINPDFGTQNVVTTGTLGSGAITSSGDIAANGGSLTTNQTTGNLMNTTATTLNIGGAATTTNIGAASGTTYIQNDAVISGADLTLGVGSTSAAGTIVFNDAAPGTLTATIKAPASVTASYTLTLPAAAGAVDQVLKTDASGNLGWVNQTAAATDATTTAKGIVQLAGDLSGTAAAPTVKGINGTALSGLSTGILKNTTTTGVPSIAVAADFPVLNQNTTGTAASFTGSLAGDVTGTQGATVVGKLQGKSVSTTAPTNGQVLKYNTTTSAWEPATDAGISSTLNSANILVGNATNVATAVAMSGDATMDNAGALTIGADKITSAKIADGTIVTGDIATGGVTSANIFDGTIATADVADGAVTAAKLNAMGATNGQVLKYNSTTSLWEPATASLPAFATTSGVTSNTPGSIGTDDFVFGATTLEGPGYRMMFDKSKGAFRLVELQPQAGMIRIGVKILLPRAIIPQPRVIILLLRAIIPQLQIIILLPRAMGPLPRLACLLLSVVSLLPRVIILLPRAIKPQQLA